MSNNIFGNVIRAQAKTIAQDLLSVVPMGGNLESFKKIHEDTEIRNRNIKIDNILNDCELPELTIEDHEDYKKAMKSGNPKGHLFYVDHIYTKKP